jgi:uncharacterized damage-inducible protein DinB
MPEPTLEPWLRGTLTEFDPLRRAVLHALELAEEDVARWTASLTDEEMFARPSGLPSVVFQMRHIVRSLDRLLTYAEGLALSEAQLEALQTEMATGRAVNVRAEFRSGLERAMQRVRSFSSNSYAEPRGVGRERLPTTVGGLLIHCAEHTQRHAGQMVTTAKVLLAARTS